MSEDHDMKILKNQLKGRHLENLLKRKAIKKYRLAKDCGITWRTVHNWIKGKVEPSDNNALLVGKYLGLTNVDEAERKREIQELRERIQRLE